MANSKSSSQIQLASIFDIHGNGLLVNEIVMNDKKYIFERVSSVLYLLVEQTTLSYTPPALQNVLSHNSLKGNTPKLKWCYQETSITVGYGKFKVSGEILAKKKLASTSKKVVFIQPSGNISCHDAKSLCDHICGRLYFPSSLSEITEIQKYENQNNDPWKIWIRIQYIKRYWFWKDSDNVQNLTILNWGVEEPKLEATNSGQANALMASDGKWYTSRGSYRNATHVICELS